MQHEAATTCAPAATAACAVASVTVAAAPSLGLFDELASEGDVLQGAAAFDFGPALLSASRSDTSFGVPGISSTAATEGVLSRELENSGSLGTQPTTTVALASAVEHDDGAASGATSGTRSLPSKRPATDGVCNDDDRSYYHGNVVGGAAGGSVEDEAERAARRALMAGKTPRQTRALDGTESAASGGGAAAAAAAAESTDDDTLSHISCYSSSDGEAGSVLRTMGETRTLADRDAGHDADVENSCSRSPGSYWSGSDTELEYPAAVGGVVGAALGGWTDDFVLHGGRQWHAVEPAQYALVSQPARAAEMTCEYDDAHNLDGALSKFSSDSPMSSSSADDGYPPAVKRSLALALATTTSTTTTTETTTETTETASSVKKTTTTKKETTTTTTTVAPVPARRATTAAAAAIAAATRGVKRNAVQPATAAQAISENERSALDDAAAALPSSAAKRTAASRAVVAKASNAKKRSAQDDVAAPLPNSAAKRTAANHAEASSAKKRSALDDAAVTLPSSAAKRTAASHAVVAKASNPKKRAAPLRIVASPSVSSSSSPAPSRSESDEIAVDDDTDKDTNDGTSDEWVAENDSDEDYIKANDDDDGDNDGDDDYDENDDDDDDGEGDVDELDDEDDLRGSRAKPRKRAPKSHAIRSELHAAQAAGDAATLPGGGSSSDDGEPRRRWTEDEDERLRQAMQLHGEGLWAKVSEVVRTRTAAQCLHRWKHTLSPNISRSKWSAREDELLRRAVDTHGWRWANVARDVPNRTGAQCRERYCNKLDPRISQNPWTPAEDRHLIETVNRIGIGHWSAITKELLVPRTDYQARKRWHVLKRSFA